MHLIITLSLCFAQVNISSAMIPVRTIGVIWRQ